jgi:non-ribosomal peptide synthetase component E (peptide arylation enzyme)
MLPQVAVPSILQLWLPQLQLHRNNLKLLQLVSSGEGLTAVLAAQLLDALPEGCALVNLYGEHLGSNDNLPGLPPYALPT